ncbi:MAG: response regulator [Proteobacteria bacterium]|nr:response regulator [Pseudomonadota bacterium]
MIEPITRASEEDTLNRSFSILVAEPSPFLGQKIADILSHDKTVLWVFHVNERSQLLREAKERRPDFILVDLKILKIPQTIDFLRQLTPLSRIIALTESVSEPYVKVTASLGLDGMIEKGHIGRNDLNQILELSDEGQAQ